MTTLDEHAAALAPLGFTPRQSRFLALVALHSGYCLRRQYLAFAGIRHGKGTRVFFDRLVSRQLAERLPCRADRGQVYHLSPRALYRSLGQEDNRNRRAASAALIARKIMVLDFVLSRLDVSWLATEQEKVAFFTTTFGLTPQDLPQRCYGVAEPTAGVSRRYFVHKLPIFLTGEHPTVHFVSLVLDATARSLDLFLADHARLLGRLPAWAVVAVAPSHTPGLRACADVFARHVHAPVRQTPVSRSELAWYFVTRRRIDSGDLSHVSVADIDRFKNLGDRFATVADETRYTRWLTNGDAVLDELTIPAGPRGLASSGRLVMHPLPFTYTQFGSFPGVA